MPVRSLCQVTIDFVFQDVMQMTECLLFRKYGYVICARVLDKLFNLIGRHRALFRADERVFLVIEYVLDV